MNTNDMVAFDKFELQREHGLIKGISTTEDEIVRARMVSRISEFLDFAFYPDSGHIHEYAQVSMNF